METYRLFSNGTVVIRGSDGMSIPWPAKEHNGKQAEKEIAEKVAVLLPEIPVQIVKQPSHEDQLDALRKAIITGDKADITAIDAELKKPSPK